jgi:predicted transcriptional regulator
MAEFGFYSGTDRQVTGKTRKIGEEMLTLVFGALSYPEVRAIIEFLAESPRDLSEIVDKFSLTRDGAGRFLRDLTRRGLVRRSETGAYTIDHQGFGLLRSWVERISDSP